MTLGAPKELSQLRRFFLQPRLPKHRQYEALRAFLVEGRPASEVARAFGYSLNSFHVLCHHFRRQPNPVFFVAPRVTAPSPNPRNRPPVTSSFNCANRTIRSMKSAKPSRSATVRSARPPCGRSSAPKALRPCPGAWMRNGPALAGPTVEPVADVREFSLTPRKFSTACGGLFLFVADLVRLGTQKLAGAAGLPGSKMIPAEHALRACLALKLWSIERKHHVMALVADEGLALFAGLNAFPKKSYLSEYSSRIEHRKTTRLLAAWHEQIQGGELLPAESFNLDFHSVPYYGEHPAVERHYVSMRSRRQPSVLVFLAQDAGSHVFCYSNADLRKGEEAEEVFQFVAFWKRTHRGQLPRHLVFDSKLTTQQGLARLDRMNIPFITLRRRSRKLLEQVYGLPLSAWRTIELDVPTRKYRTPRVFEQTVALAGRRFRQMFLQDLGHDEPTILLTNQRHATAKALVTRYAQRMLIENALSDAVRFFHIDALSSAVGLKVDFDMALLVLASGLYRGLARRMRGYGDAQARQIFRDLIDMPADVEVSEKEVTVRFHRRAHLPIILASDLVEKPVPVPWWNGLPLRLTTYNGPPNSPNT